MITYSYRRCLSGVKLNPARARRFAQAAGTLAKTDRIDAVMLARMASTMQPPVRPAINPEQARLAELISARDGLMRDRTALKNQEKNLTIPLLKRQHKQRKRCAKAPFPK
ncbi:IS110 family transposase [Mesorhizobium huakuii]|uniref:IS110 family transposase n=1 Tax=Mesorhizobium huakuii TaxID=28104 RepID=UPI003D7BAD24